MYPPTPTYFQDKRPMASAAIRGFVLEFDAGLIVSKIYLFGPGVSPQDLREHGPTTAVNYFAKRPAKRVDMSLYRSIQKIGA